MTDKILDRANSIKAELNRKRAELHAFRLISNTGHGFVRIYPNEYEPDKSYYSQTLLDYICKEDVRKSLEKSMEDAINKLEEEYTNL